MNEFRAIYHADPQNIHAPAAIAQVAELLAEQGYDFKDEKSSHDALRQCDFLAKVYPASTSAHTCYTRIGFVLKGLSRPAEAPADVANDIKLSRPDPQSMSSYTDSSKEDSAGAGALPAISLKNVPIARISGIRHWSTPSYTRVAIDLGAEVRYEAARVEHPDRIFFDLHHAQLAPELLGKTFSITDDGFLTKIRAAQYSDDVARVVLDVHEVAEYSAFLLPNPYRLIIDIHGKAQKTVELAEHGLDAPTGNRLEATAPLPASEVEKSSGVAPRRAQASHAEFSQLPPTPVTDGSVGFGLPAKTNRETNLETVPAPRVVIPAKATTAKPVPNTVTLKSAATSTEVAAVSEQPGKVEATTRPTSGPIASGSKNRSRQSGGGGGLSMVPPPPTADGQTSLVRALGLKIGRIVIDAGHGGHDSGTLGFGGIEEKDVVLDVALRLGKLLHQRLGAEIVYTRADDTFIPLETRTAIANKAQADLFISIHANSSQDASARGVEVYYLNFASDPEAMRIAGRENAVSTQSVHELSDLVKKIALKDKIDESKELAADVEEGLFAGLTKGNEGLKDRGVKKAPFVVLIGANMPSILAEISFVTNRSDAAQLQTREYRERVAESLYAGIAKYAGVINGSGTTLKAVSGR